MANALWALPSTPMGESIDDRNDSLAQVADIS